MNRQHYEITRPLDWQDRIVLQGCWLAACAVFMILVFLP